MERIAELEAALKLAVGERDHEIQSLRAQLAEVRAKNSRLEDTLKFYSAQLKLVGDSDQLNQQRVESLRTENSEQSRLIEGYKLVGKAYDSAIKLNLKLESQLAEAREVIEFTGSNSGDYGVFADKNPQVNRKARAYLEKYK